MGSVRLWVIILDRGQNEWGPDNHECGRDAGIFLFILCVRARPQGVFLCQPVELGHWAFCAGGNLTKGRYPSLDNVFCSGKRVIHTSWKSADGVKDGLTIQGERETGEVQGTGVPMCAETETDRQTDRIKPHRSEGRTKRLT